MSWLGKAINFWSSGHTEGSVLEKESWFTYKTIIFTGVVLIGGGYMLRGFASVVNEVDEALD
jgi:hypothetical protein